MDLKKAYARADLNASGVVLVRDLSCHCHHVEGSESFYWENVR